EGNREGQVGRFSYDASDATILGYGQIAGSIGDGFTAVIDALIAYDAEQTFNASEEDAAGLVFRRLQAACDAGLMDQATLDEHSIDELPQFVNVLKGEMSLVGPRPILLFEDKEYGDRLPYLLMCKPGITGYWTTHGRSAVVFPERADLELHYLEVHSLVFDAALIFMTIAQSIYGKDAY
ncbi:MAG: sugar transferase, partial [Lactococcus sp.]